MNPIASWQEHPLFDREGKGFEIPCTSLRRQSLDWLSKSHFLPQPVVKFLTAWNEKEVKVSDRTSWLPFVSRSQSMGTIRDNHDTVKGLLPLA